MTTTTRIPGQAEAAAILEDTDVWHAQAAAAVIKGVTLNHWDPAGAALVYSRLSDVLVELETLNDTMDRIADALTDRGNE